MARFLSLIFIIAVCNITNKTPVFINAKFFEYELPNRSVTICPTNSLISLECPQSPEYQTWQLNLPAFLISIDYIRSFPSRLGHDSSSCQPDLSHNCNNYDLRYINTLCNGKSQCSDIPAYQIRDRSLCAFKAITEIGFHCVPTWNLRDIQTKCDICKNGSLTNDYGFIYSRNYPLQTLRIPCFTTIYARPYHKTVLYFVSGQLNYDELRIESVSSEGITILNITLNGNHTTHQLAVSTYELKITFLPGLIYSQHPTNYLLYFYTIPFCSITEPCAPVPLPLITTSIPTIITTSRMRIQSVGWTGISNIWIIIPIILAYVLLLLLVIVLALLFQRRRKQKKALVSIGAKNLTSRYLDTSGTSSRAQLVTPLPPPPPPPNNNGLNSYRHTNVSRSTHYPITNTSFAQNMERYHRESRSDFDLHHNSMNGIDYNYHTSVPYRSHTSMSNDIRRPYGTIDYNMNHHPPRRRSLPKSFSDCDLCKRQVLDEEYQDYYHNDDNWHLENTLERCTEPKAYREKIKERFRERLTVRKIPHTDILPISTVEYSTVLPRNQRIGSESIRQNHHLPFEYIPNENSKNVRTVEYKRNPNEEHVAIGNNHQQRTMNDDNGTSNFTVKFYEQDDDEINNRLDRCLHEAREIQEMSMRMSEQQHSSFNTHQYHHQQQRYNDNVDI